MPNTREHIRNFSIIAHIDHGKSTLADRLLERTGAIEKRKMREQALDTMDLERERGITIKLAPASMSYVSGAEHYTLNLIDTPGHIDFSYEVSRALKAVEGSVLLVDATQGIQAQTLETLSAARVLGLVIVPVVTKIDVPHARAEDVAGELARLLDCGREDVLFVSGKTGEGVGDLLAAIVDRIPAPQSTRDVDGAPQVLVFDFQYSTHRGVIVYARVFNGSIVAGDKAVFTARGDEFRVQEVGVFGPEPRAVERLFPGDIGYIVTGMKEAAGAVVGDTVTDPARPAEPLSGYREPQPVVWASLYPESQDDFAHLKQALERLKLSDAALVYEEEVSPALGRGFRCGFLGMLHLEIIAERVQREFQLALIVTSPSIEYDVRFPGGRAERIYSPALFPDHGTYEAVYEPYARVKIIVPNDKIGDVFPILYAHEAELGDSESFAGDRLSITAELPLREVMRGLFDELKGATSGYASFSYEIGDMRPADVTRLDILVAEERIPAFSQVVARSRAYEEAKDAVERLYRLLPRQLFATKIQGKALGRILSSETLPALKKDVTGHLYGGDITRKRKLWEKQKKGKKKLAARGRGQVSIPHDVFMKMMRR